MRRIPLLFLIILGFFTDALASYVILKNGDRITGTMVAATNAAVTLRSPLIGDVVIPRSAIERSNIEEGAPVSSAAAPVAPAAEVENGGWTAAFRNWSGSIDPGFTWTQGNSNTRTLNLGISAARTTANQKVSFSINWLHTNSLSSGRAFTTAKAVRSGTRYDFNLNQALFVFGSGDWEYDRFQQLDLRNVLGTGVGWHAVRRSNFRVDLMSGGNFNRESYRTGLKRRFVEGILGQEVDYRPNGHLILKGRLMLIPNLTELGHYRANLEASAVTSLNKYLGWQITLTDRYTTLPLPTVKPNDLVVTTGLRIAFSR